MKYAWLDDYLISKTGAVKEYKTEWAADRYMLKDKMFCLIGENNNRRSIVTLKCEPLFGEALRKKYADITPGYYMNKIHWNSVYLDGEVPDGVLKEMIDMSHSLVFASLSKKAQAELRAQNA
jgi:predicted DNA-binding protein (MmcQ/YjbR family)